MEHRDLGGSGIRASAVGLGTWAIGGWLWGGSDRQAAAAAIRAAVDNGITLIDTAPGYGLGLSEQIIGDALEGRRDKVVLATKCGLVWHVHKGEHFFDQMGQAVHRYLGAESVRHELEESLRRLRTDHVDLYQTHWQDPTTPIAETMDELVRLKKEGKIRAIGPATSARPKWPGTWPPGRWPRSRRSSACWTGASRSSSCPWPARRGSPRSPILPWPSGCSPAR